MRRALCISSVIGGIVGVIFQGSAIHNGILLAAAGLLAVHGAFVVFGGLVAIGEGKANLSTVVDSFGHLLFIGSAIIVSWGTGYAIRAWQVSAMEKYVQRAMPLLEEINQRSGRYPTALPEKILGHPPYLLRSPKGYSSNGISFRFEYPAAIRLFDENWVFSSKHRRWGRYNGETYGSLLQEERRP